MKKLLRKFSRNCKAVYLKRLYDRRFSRQKFRYIGQCLLATAVLLGVIVSLNIVSHAVVVASIGATAFIIFTVPHKRDAGAKYVIGGCVIGIIVGTLCYAMAEISWLHHIPIIDIYREEIFAALAVGVTMFAMIMFNMEHPPAASLSLGLVLNGASIRVVTVTLIAIIATMAVKTMLKRRLINLL